MEENFENQVQGNVQPNEFVETDFIPQEGYIDNNVEGISISGASVSAYTEAPVVNNTVVSEAVVTESQVQPAQIQVAQEAPVQAAPAPVPPTPPAQAEVELKSPVEFKPEDVRIVVKTDILKEAVKKADAVASKDNMQPFTEVIMFRVVDNGILQVRSTDRDNILTVNVPVIEATPNAAMTIRADQIKPLLDKLPKADVVAFQIEESIITVYAGVGTYKLQQALDLTTNKIIQLPDIDNDIPFESAKEISKDRFISYIEAVLPLVSKIANDNQYAAIYFGKYVATADGDDASVVNDDITSVVGGTIFLKTSTAKHLLSMGTGDKLYIGFGEFAGSQTLCIYTNDYRLFSVAKSGLEEYPVESIDELLSMPKGEAMTIKKDTILGALDRLSLFFITGLTRQVIDVEISNRKIIFSNESKAVESYPIQSSRNIKFKIDVAEVMNIIKGIKAEDLILEPVMDGEGPIPYIRISDGNKVLTVKGTAL